MGHSEYTLLLSFIFLLIIAGLTSYFAARKQRNPFIWFVIGLLLGVIGLLILLFLPAAKNKENQGQNLPITPIAESQSSLSYLPVSPSEEKIQSEEENKLWYYLDQSHQQMGPVSIVALRELWNRGKLELDQYVWSEGMEKWEKVDHLSELKKILNKP